MVEAEGESKSSKKMVLRKNKMVVGYLAKSPESNKIIMLRDCTPKTKQCQNVKDDLP